MSLIRSLFGRRWFRVGGFIVALGLISFLGSTVGRLFGRPVGDAFAALLICTPFIFWGTVERQRQYWRFRTYWAAIGGLLVVHVIAFMGVLTSHPEWRAWQVAVGAFLEVAILAAVLEALFMRTESRRDKPVT